MKVFQMIISIFLLPYMIWGENFIHYHKYIHKLKQQNIDLKIQKEKLKRVETLIRQKKALIRSPIFLDLQIETGTFRSPYNYLTGEFPANQPIRMYSIGISKMIDFLNQQKTEREIFEIQKEIEKHFQYILEKRIFLNFRNAYFTAIFLNYLKEHLKEHIDNFQKLKKRFGYGYLDKRLGYYTIPALEMGISTLQTEYQDTEALYLNEMKIMYNLLFWDLPKEDIVLDSFDSITKILPDSIDFSILKANLEKSPIFQIEVLKLQLQRKKILFSKKQVYQNTEFFLNYGKRNLGNYQDPAFQGANPEQESFLGLGIKIPLPYGSESLYQVEVQEQNFKIQKLQFKKIKKELQNQLEVTYKNYLNHYRQYKNNLKTIQKYQPFLKMLEHSLVSRRITYFEYWGEHERYHNLLKMTAHSYQMAMESLSMLEILSGLDLDYYQNQN